MSSSTHKENEKTLYAVIEGYSQTLIVGFSFSDVKEKYLRFKKMPKEELREHEGYFPGCYAENSILGGETINWYAEGSFEPSYTEEKLEILLSEGYVKIRELRGGVAFTSFLDG